MITREANNIQAMSEAMRADVDGSGYKGKLYKAEGGSGTEVQRFNQAKIKSVVDAAANGIASTRERVDLYDVAEVRRRTVAYVIACRDAALMPGLSGLCGYAFQCSRQWVSKFMLANPEHETTKFLETAKEVFADCLANGALSGASNTVMSLFLLKNGYGYSDKVEIEATANPEPDDKISADEIAKRYMLEGYEDDSI